MRDVLVSEHVIEAGYNLCGIGACLSLIKRNIAGKILIMLKNLEYRGYDSAGIAVITPENTLDLRKGVGKIDDLKNKLHFDQMVGFVGIGHTRWATHGGVTEENAHPHTDCDGRIVVVHNGIIENYLEIRKELETRGHKFRSDTDTEIVPHLIEEFIKRGNDFYEAFKNAVKKLKGAYALAVVSTYEPNKILFARVFSPLVIGLGTDEYYIASDIPAFLEWTNKVIILEDGDIGYVSQGGVLIENVFLNRRVHRDVTTIPWTKEMAKKGGFPHFMLKEIFEQPQSVSRTILMARKQIDRFLDYLEKAEEVYIVAAGTSYYASLHGQYAFAKYGLRSRAVVASEFIEEVGGFIGNKDLVIGVSQSGETADTLLALRYAKKKGAKVVAITNVIGSAITRISDYSIIMGAGPEIGVAATKTFTAQVAVLNYALIKWAEMHGYDMDDVKRVFLNNIGEKISNVLEKANSLAKKLSEWMVPKSNAYYLGRGLGLPIALEGALKMKEIAYIHAEGYPAGESKHGPIALIEKDFPVISIVLNDHLQEKMLIAIEEMKSRGAYIISVCEEGMKKIQEKSDFIFEIPSGFSNILAPLVYIIPLQLLAYYTAVKRGCDPDKPRNLAKSVTVE